MSDALFLARPVAARQHRLQKRPGIALLLAHDVLGRARGDDFAAGVAAFGAEVDDPVGGLDHFEIVLDDDHGIALVGQFVQHVEQFRHVVEMQPGGGFI